MLYKMTELQRTAKNRDSRRKNLENENLKRRSPDREKAMKLAKYSGFYKIYGSINLIGPTQTWGRDYLFSEHCLHELISQEAANDVIQGCT